MRRALIVGIDKYPCAELGGCENDALSLAKVLSRHDDGSRNFQCETVTSRTHNVTRALLREKIYRLLKDPIQAAYLHFSGHGTVQGIGGYLVTTDHRDYDLGIPMTEVLALANQAEIDDVFITLDCCDSGMFGNMPGLSSDKLILAEGVSIITATRGGQEALEANGSGVFTSLLVEALQGGSGSLLGKVTAASVYAYIDSAFGAWEQRPLFKANVSKFLTLRNAKPKIELEVLRKITEYFQLPAEPLQLSPEHEPSEEPRNTAKEEIFRHLQRFRHVGLVEPIGEEHMYYAAVNSKSCGLTTLGKYYWRLVYDEKL